MPNGRGEHRRANVDDLRILATDRMSSGIQPCVTAAASGILQRPVAESA